MQEKPFNERRHCLLYYKANAWHLDLSLSYSPVAAWYFYFIFQLPLCGIKSSSEWHSAVKLLLLQPVKEEEIILYSIPGIPAVHRYSMLSLQHHARIISGTWRLAPVLKQMTCAAWFITDPTPLRPIGRVRPDSDWCVGETSFGWRVEGEKSMSGRKQTYSGA